MKSDRKDLSNLRLVASLGAGTLEKVLGEDLEHR